MAEALALIGGISSISTILVQLAKATRALSDICAEVSDAPGGLRQARDNLTLLQGVLEGVHSCLDADLEHQDGAILPLNTRRHLEDALLRIHPSLEAAQQRCQRSKLSPQDKHNRCKRLLWVLKDKPALDKFLQELECLNGYLSLVLQVANLLV